MVYADGVSADLVRALGVESLLERCPMFRLSRAGAPAAILVLFCAGVAAADWTRFRGPNGSGVSADDKPTPVKWSESHNLKWKTALPGPGASCPIIVGDRIYVTCYSGYGITRQDPGDISALKRHLVSLDRATGKRLWSKTIDSFQPEDPYSGAGVPEHGYATHTPVSDGQNIFVFFGKSGVLAFDRNGEQLWHTSVGTESDPPRWGSASSPILYKNLLIVPATAESEALVALDKKTGEPVWRAEASGFSMSWSTPILVPVDDTRVDLVVGVGREIWGFNPDTGKLRWFCEGIKNDSFSSSVVAHGDIVFAVEGDSGSLAVRAGGKGDVTDSHVVWKGRDSGQFASPIVHKGRIYVIANNIVTSIDEKSGKRLSRSRITGDVEGPRRGGGGADYASPVLSDNRIYYVKRSGDVHVLSTGDEIQQLAVNRVTRNAEDFSATPAISDGELLIRSDKTLYCIASLDKAPSQVAGRPADSSIRPTKLADAGAQSARRGGGGRGNTFERRDRNGDGKLSGRELTPRLRSRLAKIDSDKDGAISQAEYEAEMGTRSTARRRQSDRGRQGAKKPDRPRRPELEG